MSDTNFVVHESKGIIWVGILCMLFFGTCIVFTAIFINHTAKVWLYLGFAPLFLLGVYVVLRCMFWRLEVNGDEFCYTSFLGLKKNFTVNEITKVIIKKPGSLNPNITLYSETKKLFTAEPNCTGYILLEEYLIRNNIAFKYPE